MNQFQQQPQQFQQNHPQQGYANYVVPTLQDLYADDATAWKNDRFMQLLNSEPPAHWVKVEKNIAYLPIDKVELLLDRIFVGRVMVEVKECKVMVNAVQTTVRLTVFHPVLQMWVYNDGVGAMPIQLAKGANGDLTKVNHSAIQMNAPASVSYAVKDAAERFGKIFGRDLSRKDTVNYQPAFLSDPFVTGNPMVTSNAADIVAPPVPQPPAMPGQFQQWNGNGQVQQPQAQQPVQQQQQPIPQPQSQPGQFSAGFLNSVNGQQAQQNNFTPPNQQIPF